MKVPKWYEQPWIGFDTETTGTDPMIARILQAAILTHDPEGILAEEDRVVYINPGVPIPPQASAIHGLTIEKLIKLRATGPQNAIPYILEMINRRATLRSYPLVIYNTSYDWPLLLAECKRLPAFHLPGTTTPLFLDPLVIDRAMDKYRKGSRKLEDTARFYEVELTGAHGAQADAKAALGIMGVLISTYPELKTHTLAELQQLQAEWYEEWKDHLNEYWERTGRAERITGSWPLGEAEAVAVGAAR